MATFFFFFFEPGVKLDEKSIENGLEGQKFLVVCLFWGGCHHPNIDYQISERFLGCYLPFCIIVSPAANLKTRELKRF